MSQSWEIFFIVGSGTTWRPTYKRTGNCKKSQSPTTLTVRRAVKEYFDSFTVSTQIQAIHHSVRRPSIAIGYAVLDEYVLVPLPLIAGEWLGLYPALCAFALDGFEAISRLSLLR